MIIGHVDYIPKYTICMSSVLLHDVCTFCTIASYETFVPFVHLQFTRLVQLCYLSLNTSLSHLHSFSIDSISSHFCWHCNLVLSQLIALQLNLGCSFSWLWIWLSLAISDCSLESSICTVVFNFDPHIYW